MDRKISRAVRACYAQGGRIPRAVAGVMRREPYPSEAVYFAANPHVAGMASEDDRIILNPFSPNDAQAQTAVATNESARVHMRTNPELRPRYDLTPEQASRFGSYGGLDDQRQTIAARLVSGDGSAGTASPAQVAFRNKLAKAMGQEYADGGDVEDKRSAIRRAYDTGIDYAGRGLALADLYSGGMLSSVAGLNPFGSYQGVMESRERALAGVPREAKAAATEPFTPYAAIFAGPMARTANRKMLQRAEELAAQNAPREQIWSETGWFQGPDKKWRFEIDDSQAFIKGGDRSASESARLWGPKFVGPMHDKAVMAHDKLAEAYPQLAAVEFEGHPGRGGHYRRELLRGDVVSIGDDYRGKDKTSVGLHEAQHLVQGEEDFAPGAAVGLFTQQSDAKLASDAMSWRREMKRYQGDHSYRDNAVVEDYYKIGAPDWIPSRRARDVAMDVVGNPDDELEKIIKLYGLDRRTSPYTPKEMYNRTAGEVEARAVQSRMKLSPEQRRARAPWLDYEVPEQDQIVRFR